MSAFAIKSVLLDGSNEYVTVGDVLDKLRTDAFSVGLWVKATNVAATRFLITKFDIAAADGWGLYLTATGQFSWFLESAVNQVDWITTVTTNYDSGVLDGWLFVVATSEGTGVAGMHIYVNGAEVAITVTQSDLATNPITNSSSLNIGSYDDTTTNVVGGNLTHAFMYSKALSEAEVFTIWNWGEPVDLTATGPTADLEGYWKLGDGDTHPTATDSEGVNDGTYTNTEAGDLEDDAPNTVSAPGGEEKFPHPADANPRGQGIRNGSRYWGNLALASPGIGFFATSASALIYDGDPFLGVSPPGDVEGLGEVLARNSGLSYADYDMPPEQIGGGADLTLFFKMRALLDPGPGFVTWKVQDEADFLGAQAGAAIIPGSAIVASRWAENT